MLNRTLLLLMAMTLVGCGPPTVEERVWQMRDDLQSQQTQINEQAARLDAQRTDILAAAREVGQQRDQLETDRREFEARERRDFLLAAAMSSGTLLLCCGLPVLALVLLAWPRKATDAEIEASDVLIEHLQRQHVGLIEDRRAEPPKMTAGSPAGD